MGRIKTRLIKRLAHQLVKIHKPKLSTDFTENNKVISSYFSMDASKKLRNCISGYVTRLMKIKE
ncbi:MAG: 30S ribosomal protein S17e [Candidatus Woesearchaeota archaeon]|jgi:ribosomal protein S17E|nr:30S ribosomal protein S17e [Candidatus Woesearchaeota archaeon]MDP7181392.1 30S ribosomal protein S17e [Candidatus Woesearchaeota archaeon]MDP7197990.1 30S ribosomal protein S17e [Candidatus Woesearchaeota archaeon]MDP7466824.1 30S ribosomal protein S17e [Candidatus Woesearchaeota archaeon]MDP7648049.1 30S ribosomal protein S17e [Candidatus Woesearchaeota archaeon]